MQRYGVCWFDVPCRVPQSCSVIFIFPSGVCVCERGGCVDVCVWAGGMCGCVWWLLCDVETNASVRLCVCFGIHKRIHFWDDIPTESSLLQPPSCCRDTASAAYPRCNWCFIFEVVWSKGAAVVDSPLMTRQSLSPGQMSNQEDLAHVMSNQIDGWSLIFFLTALDWAAFLPSCLITPWKAMVLPLTRPYLYFTLLIK